MRLHFTVETRPDGYAITAATEGREPRLLRDGIKGAKQARRDLSAYEAGALLAGAVISSSMPSEVRAK